MKVSGLYIYPIKSLQGISLRQADVLERGFKHDRRWMLVNHENVQITQRTHPQLSQVGISLGSQNIVASFNDMPALEIPLSLSNEKNIAVRIWDDRVSGLQAPEHINKWFSTAIKEPCKLVFMPENTTRLINPERAINGENVSFADGYPYLLLGQSSLDDLNSRIEVELPMNRFRPNMVVEGSKPYAEDDWRNIQIGKVKFHVTHPCKRCVFTTIDQETGAKGSEPLKTLSSYRRQGKEVVFGVNTLALSTGRIQLGDAIELSS